MSKFKTPISDETNMSLGSKIPSGNLLDAAIESEVQWIYRIGIKLDRVVPLQGYNNYQRIEIAINMLLEGKSNAPG